VSSLFTYVSNTKVASHFALNLVTLVVLSKTRIRFFFMEACFHHRMKNEKKVIATFFSQLRVYI